MINTTKGFSLGKFLVKLALFTIIIYGIHSYLIQPYLSNYTFSIENWKIYLFHFATVGALIYFLQHRSEIAPEKTMNTFIILSILKMIAAIVFLLPLFLNKTIDPKASIISFFISYFLFLFLEAQLAVKILNAKK